jgi:signal peptidase I
MNWKPKKWTAALLGLFALPLALLYVARPILAAVYLGAYLLISLANVAFLHSSAVSSLIPFALVLAGTWHAYRLAGNYPADTRRPWYSHWYGLVAVGALVVLVFGGIRAFLFEPFKVPSGAMIPSIPPHSHVIATKWGYGNYRAYGVSLARTELSAPLNRGDIVVFEYPVDRSLDYVKRVTGLPGDKVSYRSKQLSINGREVPTRRVEEYRGSSKDYWGTAYSQFAETLDDTEYRIIQDSTAPALMPPAMFVKFRDRCSISMTGIDCEVPPGHLFVLGDNRDNSSDSRVWGFVPIRNVVGRVVHTFP